MAILCDKSTKLIVQGAISPIGKTWMNGSTLHVRFLGGRASQHALVKEQAGWWTQHASLKFVFDNAANAEIRISYDPGDGAWSYVGTDCHDIPANEATMNLGFMDGGTSAHEFGHAIGLAHEHQNPAGGIQWNEEVVIRECARSPNCWDEATTRHNILRKYSAEQINGTAFDPKSIMLYFFPPEWTLNGIGTEANEVLSGLDKLFVAGARMYPKTAPTVAEATVLRPNATRRTAADIGQFGEEDLFVFAVTRARRYVIDTKGPTDVVMKPLARDPDPAGLAWYVGELQAGRRTLQTITLDVLNGATTAPDSTVVANKLDVATYFTAKVAAGCVYGSEQDGTNLIAGVTASAATVTAAKAAIDARCGA